MKHTMILAVTLLVAQTALAQSARPAAREALKPRETRTNVDSATTIQAVESANLLRKAQEARDVLGVKNDNLAGSMKEGLVKLVDEAVAMRKAGLSGEDKAVYDGIIGILESAGRAKHAQDQAKSSETRKLDALVAQERLTQDILPSLLKDQDANVRNNARKLLAEIGRNLSEGQAKSIAIVKAIRSVYGEKMTTEEVMAKIKEFKECT